MTPQAWTHWRNKKRLGSRPNPPKNKLYVAMRTLRRRRLFRECRPRRRNLLHRSFTSLVANRWNCSKQSTSLTRFDGHTYIVYSKWGITSMLLRGVNADTDSSLKESLIIKGIRLALQWMEGENSNIKGSLTTFLTCMESSGISVVKHNWTK